MCIQVIQNNISNDCLSFLLLNRNDTTTKGIFAGVIRIDFHRMCSFFLITYRSMRGRSTGFGTAVDEYPPFPPADDDDDDALIMFSIYSAIFLPPVDDGSTRAI